MLQILVLRLCGVQSELLVSNIMLLSGKADIVVLVDSLIPLVRYPGIRVHLL